MRNMIDVNTDAFANLIEAFVVKQSLSVELGVRFFKTDDNEKNWIKNASISEKLVITPDIRLIKISLDDVTYFAVIGAFLDTSFFEKGILDDASLNAGIITLLISLGFLSLDKKANLLEFYDSILFQHKDKDYKGHDYSELIPFLEQIYLFSSPDYSIVKSNALSRIGCYVFSKNPSQLVLDFEHDVLNVVSDLSIVGSDNISYKILLSCLFSTTYKHAFLELYRLIERLFPINYLREFHVKSETKLSFLDFTAALDDITSWRPREDDAIEKIFENTRPSVLLHFENFHQSSLELKDFKKSKYFYSLRNSIVHFRANHLEYELTNKQWNLLLLATILMLDEQYSIHNQILK